MPKPEQVLGLYRSDVFFVIVAVLPLVVVGICIAMYLQRHHRLPGNVFELARELPESRTFSVGINVCAWMSIPVYLLVDRILKLKCRLEKRETLLNTVLRYLMDMSGGCSFFSLLAVASVSVMDQKWIHDLAAGVFVVSLTLYFVLADIIMNSVSLRVTVLDWIWDIAGAILFVVSLKQSYFQYAGGAGLFLKFLGLLKTLPGMRVMLKTKPE